MTMSRNCSVIASGLQVNVTGLMMIFLENLASAQPGLPENQPLKPQNHYGVPFLRYFQHSGPVI